MELTGSRCRGSGDLLGRECSGNFGGSSQIHKAHSSAIPPSLTIGVAASILGLLESIVMVE